MQHRGPAGSLPSTAQAHSPCVIGEPHQRGHGEMADTEPVSDIRHDLNQRTWKAIPGYEGLYEASDDGLIRALPRVVIHYRGGPSRRKSRLMAPASKLGYLRVSLTDVHGRTRQWPVHRLVLAAFTGRSIDNESQCNHRNGRKADNRVANLEWCTPSENIRHSYRVLGFAGSRAKGPVKVTFPDGREKVYRYANEAKVDGFLSGAISKVLRGAMKTHKGCRFERIEQYMEGPR